MKNLVLLLSALIVGQFAQAAVTDDATCVVSPTLTIAFGAKLAQIDDNGIAGPRSLYREHVVLVNGEKTSEFIPFDYTVSIEKSKVDLNALSRFSVHFIKINATNLLSDEGDESTVSGTISINVLTEDGKEIKIPAGTPVVCTISGEA